MKKIKGQFRQGDVLIEVVNGALPEGVDAKERGRAILAHGEVTGHAHEIEEPGRAVLEKPVTAVGVRGDLGDSATATRLVLKLGQKSAVKHQEHSRIELPKGKLVVTRQREYSPEAIRNVAD